MDIYILQTPLFRVRNKKETIYCYSDEERKVAIEKLKPKPEITRFKGLGEISPDEFKNFIGETIRFDPVMMEKTHRSNNCCLSTWEKIRQTDKIIKNLKVELDVTDAV
jgi:topoisomerase-4 subunit B